MNLLTDIDLGDKLTINKLMITVKLMLNLNLIKPVCKQKSLALALIFKRSPSRRNKFVWMSFSKMSFFHVWLVFYP